MKRQILDIADDLSNDAITPEQAQTLLLRLFGVSGILPINDTQIRCYGLLQLIARAEMEEPSPYNPENDIRNRNIAKWKHEYYSLIGN